jgi:hypothetical protein
MQLLWRQAKTRFLFVHFPNVCGAKVDIRRVDSTTQSPLTSASNQFGWIVFGRAHLTKPKKSGAPAMKNPTLHKRNALPQLHIWLWSKEAFSVVVECADTLPVKWLFSRAVNTEKNLSRLQKKMVHIIVDFSALEVV